MKTIILMFSLLLGTISCIDAGKDLHIITSNNGGECEDYQISIDYVSNEYNNVLTYLGKYSQTELNQFDIKLYSIPKDTVEKYRDEDFIYFSEEFKDCSVSLNLCSKEEGDISLSLD